MVYRCKKLFNGFASVRDYVVRKCIKRNDDLVIQYKNEQMTVPLHKLKNPDLYQIHRTKFNSRYRVGQEYELYDFYFEADNRQRILL